MNNKLSVKYKEKDIHKRIYEFVIQVIKFTKLLHKTTQNMVIIHQVVKSVSSMGANDREADASESRKDFLAKYTIVKKEANETVFWLEVIRDTNKITVVQVEVNELISEGTEIYKIIRSIIVNTKNRP